MACWLRSPLLANLLKLFSISAFRMYGLMCKGHGIDSGLLLEREHTLGNAWEQWDHLRKVLMYGVNSPLYLLKFHAKVVPGRREMDGGCPDDQFHISNINK